MHIRSRRSFTVETKSGGRRQTDIPSRAPPPADRGPAAFRPLPAEPQASVAEPRRILPSLIVQEASLAEPEPTQRRRGRPRKAPQDVVEPVAESASKTVPALVTQVTEVRFAPAKRAARPAAVLSPGERWKRRLGRWSR